MYIFNCMLAGGPSEQQEREREARCRAAKTAEPHLQRGQNAEREPGLTEEAFSAGDSAEPFG